MIKIKLREGDKAIIRFSNKLEEQWYVATMAHMRDDKRFSHPDISLKDRNNREIPGPPAPKPVIIKSEPSGPMNMGICGNMVIVKEPVVVKPEIILDPISHSPVTDSGVFVNNSGDSMELKTVVVPLQTKLDEVKNESLPK